MLRSDMRGRLSMTATDPRPSADDPATLLTVPDPQTGRRRFRPASVNEMLCARFAAVRTGAFAACNPTNKDDVGDEIWTM